MSRAHRSLCPVPARRRARVASARGPSRPSGCRARARARWGLGGRRAGGATSRSSGGDRSAWAPPL